MSLINDALKRAAADKPRDAQASAPVPLQPVEVPRPNGSPILLGGVLLLGVGAVGIAAALWFGGKSTKELAVAPAPAASLPSETSVSSQPPEASRSLETKAVEPTPPAQPIQTAVRLQAVVARNDSGQTPVSVAPQTTAQSAPPATESPGAGAVTSAVASTAAAAPAVNPDIKEPRLQSIFYRLRGPTVILNGKTLKVGDSVDGIKVMSIQRTSVEVMQNGKYRTLTLQH